MARGKSRYDDDYDYDDDYADDEYEEEEYEDERYRRPRPHPRPHAQARKRPRRRRRRWPFLLLGCFGGVVLVVAAIAVLVFVAISRTTGTIPLPGGASNVPGIGGSNPSAITKTVTQSVSIPGNKASLVQVHNQIGNIAVSVDPNAQQVSVSALKTVKAANQSATETELNAMQVQAGFDTGKSVLTVSASVPNSSSLIGSHNDTIDLTIVVPPLNNGNTPVMLDFETLVGNVQVSGLNGVMTVKDDIGNVTVQQAQLFDGSHLQTGTGNVTFSGSLDTTLNPRASYKMQSEVGNLNVTLPATTSVLLDANTNVGNIKSAFPINAQNSNGSASYYGPSLPGTSPAPTVTLVLDVSSGNIGIQFSTLSNGEALLQLTEELSRSV